MLSRYHLWFAVPSRKRPRGVPTHSRAVTGAPGTRLLSDQAAVRVSAPRCIPQASFPPFPPARGSLGKASPRTSPFLRYIQGLFYPINMCLSTQIPSFLPPKKGSRPRFPGKSRRLRRTASQHANDTVNKQEASRSPKVTFPDTFPPGPAVPQHFSAVPLSPGCRR